MNKLKGAFFIDLDKTLVPRSIDRTKVSLTNIYALKRAQREGWLTVITTGRSKEDLLPIWKKIYLNQNADFVIHSAGAVLENLKTNEVFINENIDNILLEKYIEILKKQNASIKLSHNSNFFVPKKNIKTWFWHKFFKLSFDVYKNINLNKPTNKIGFIYGPFKYKKTRSAQTKFEKLFPEFNFSITGSKVYLEATSKKASKGIAIKKLETIKKFPMNKTIGIGDSMNDYSMMQVVEESVAMKNSMKNLKKICKYETDTDANDGVAKIINYFLDKENNESNK